MSTTGLPPGALPAARRGARARCQRVCARAVAGNRKRRTAAHRARRAARRRAHAPPDMAPRFTVIKRLLVMARACEEGQPSVPAAASGRSDPCNSMIYAHPCKASYVLLAIRYAAEHVDQARECCCSAVLASCVQTSACALARIPYKVATVKQMNALHVFPSRLQYLITVSANSAISSCPTWVSPSKPMLQALTRCPHSFVGDARVQGGRMCTASLPSRRQHLREL
jgi:hypothetical protein